MNKSCEQALALVRHLRLEGVSVWADQQGDIHVMPAILTREDQELIRAHKPAVVTWLRQYATSMLPDDATLRQWQSEACGRFTAAKVPLPPPIRQIDDNEFSTPPPRNQVAGEQPTENPAQEGGRPKRYNMALTATRSDLVAEYRRKPQRKFLQIDAWREDEPRMYEPHYTDATGDVTQGINAWELRNTNCPVRIQIPVDADKELVVTLLKKVLHKFECGWWEELKLLGCRADTPTMRTALAQTVLTVDKASETQHQNNLVVNNRLREKP